MGSGDGMPLSLKRVVDIRLESEEDVRIRILEEDKLAAILQYNIGWYIQVSHSDQAGKKYLHSLCNRSLHSPTDKILRVK